MELLYGTGNPAKLASMRQALAELSIELCGLADMPVTAPETPEIGASPMENARIKAWAYFRAFGMPVFSCDSGLTIDGLPVERQPGVNVRNVAGRRLDDDEMIAHYAAIAREMGGRAVARYRNAVCLIINENNVYEQFDETLASRAFYLVAVPHARRNPGFPLDSLSVHIATGAYYYDLEDREIEENLLNLGFARFFRHALRL